MKDITERIKTFSDACRELGMNLVEWYEKNRDEEPDILAYKELRIICKALNEGWEPTYKNREERWGVRFHLMTNDDYERARRWWFEGEDEKLDDSLVSTRGYKAHCGFAYFFVSSELYSGTRSDYMNHHLCFKTVEIAEYCGRQFKDLWADLCLIRNQ